MKRGPLTASQADTMDALAMEVVGSIEEHGLTAILIISGRGYERLAISKENASDAPLLMAGAYASLCRHNAKEAN